MRKLLLCVYLFCGIMLFPQDHREAKIFIQPIVGTSIPGDNVYFFRQISFEAAALQAHAFVRDFRESDYILRGSIIHPNNLARPTYQGTIGPNNVLNIEILDIPRESILNYSDYEEGASIFDLELVDTKTGETIAQQYIVYKSLDNLDELVSELVYNVLSHLIGVRKDYWRDKWLFLSANALWSPRIYTGIDSSVFLGNPGFGLAAEFHFLNFLSVEAGADLIQDYFNYSPNEGDEHRDLTLEIPIALKFVIKPPGSYVLGIYGGVQPNISLMGNMNPSFMAWLGGVQLGLKAGPGMITIDARAARDFTDSSIEDRPLEYRRTIIRMGIGYKYGFFNRK